MMKEETTKAQNSNQKTPKRKTKVILIAILLILAIFVASIAYLLTPGKETVDVEIASGTAFVYVSQQLADAGVIRAPFLFRVYAKWKGEGNEIQAGVHTFTKPMRYWDVLAELKAPANSKDSVTVTIPEGYEVHQIADALDSAGVCDRDAFMECVKNTTFDYPFLKDLPERDIPLEGYLFPDTYQFDPNTPPDDCIRTMLNQFEKKVYTEENRKRAEEMGYSFDEIITMSSIVEREAAGDIDRSKVASVFYNRLNSDYRYLESCATIQYVLGERKPKLSYEDTQINSPYNTYIHQGLPIGPIASPGLESIEAALYPADTDYKYFVVGKDGQHVFSKTYEEHLKAQE